MGSNLYLPHVRRGHLPPHQRPCCVGAVQFQRGLGHVSCFVQREGADDLFGQAGVAGGFMPNSSDLSMLIWIVSRKFLTVCCFTQSPIRRDKEKRRQFCPK